MACAKPPSIEDQTPDRVRVLLPRLPGLPCSETLAVPETQKVAHQPLVGPQLAAEGGMSVYGIRSTETEGTDTDLLQINIIYFLILLYSVGYVLSSLGLF